MWWVFSWFCEGDEIIVVSEFWRVWLAVFCDFDFASINVGVNTRVGINEYRCSGTV
jgi:hypothetical protein